jgi:hypothetical protein
MAGAGGLRSAAIGERPGVASMTGTIILCDQVYQAQGGKFVIAGTYTTIEVRCKDLRRAEHQVNGLNLYLRVRPERLGVHQCRITVRDELQPPWHEPVLATQWEARVDERSMRLLEMAMMSPPFVVRPQLPEAAISAGAVTLRYSIAFLIDGEVIATTPLDIAFVQEQPRPAPPA